MKRITAFITALFLVLGITATNGFAQDNMMKQQDTMKRQTDTMIDRSRGILPSSPRLVQGGVKLNF
jgi:hypothetical protein